MDSRKQRLDLATRQALGSRLGEGSRATHLPHCLCLVIGGSDAASHIQRSALRNKIAWWIRRLGRHVSDPNNRLLARALHHGTRAISSNSLTGTHWQRDAGKGARDSLSFQSDIGAHNMPPKLKLKRVLLKQKPPPRTPSQSPLLEDIQWVIGRSRIRRCRSR